MCQHCQSVLSWQAILLDAVPSAFLLRSLRRGRGGLSFAWQLFSCRFISMGITSFQTACRFISMGITSFQTAFDFAIHYVWSGKSCFLRLHLEFRRLAQNRDIGFVRYSVLKNSLHYYPPGSRFCYPILRKNYFLSPIPNGRGRILSLFQKYFAKNNALRKQGVKIQYTSWIFIYFIYTLNNLWYNITKS